MERCKTEEERKLRRKQAQKRYYEKHKEELIEYSKKYHQDNKERCNELATKSNRKFRRKKRIEKYMPIAKKLYLAIKYENLSFDDFLNEILELTSSKK